MTLRKIDTSLLGILLTGGLILTLYGLMRDIQIRKPEINAVNPSVICKGDIEQTVILSKSQFAQVLAVPERDSKQSIRDILKSPYCMLPSIEIRSGVMAEREIYPLSFKANTWIILLFENDEYAGYQINGQT